MDGVRERPRARVPQPGPAPATGEAAAAGNEQPLTRRRARAELRSWGAGAPEGGSGDGVPPGQPTALLVETGPEPAGTVLEEAGQGEAGVPEPDESVLPTAPEVSPDSGQEDSAESAGGPDVDTEAETEAEPEAEPESESLPEPESESEGQPEPEPEAEPEPVAEPESEGQPEAETEPESESLPELEPESTSLPDVETEAEPGLDLETETEPRRPVVLPELPVAPPASPSQKTGRTAADAAEPNGNETVIETEIAQPSKEGEAQADAQEPDRETHPAGLPLDAVLMPTDLRERTRLAVRGEPNDVRRATFLDTQTAKIPATRGFRGFLASLGIRIAPSARELDERQDTRTVSQHWPGPRTISVVNGKGGANKTPTTVMLAAIFARNGGGPVLAWDNNETRGTLGWRTEQAQHDATIMDLMPETGLLLSPAAQSAMLARFVHHQTDDKYDVLRSNPNVLASEQKVTKADFDALHAVASKYFRLSIVDSGNDESAERWLRMIDHTDQLVIATTTVEEHAEAGALLLEALSERGGRYAELARGAVVIVSQADRNGTEAQARRVAEAFKVLARAAVTIPYDPALVKGQIRYASLRPATQRAWLKAAAAVAGGL